MPAPCRVTRTFRWIRGCANPGSDRASAAVAGLALESLSREHGRALTPAQVVAAASAVDSPLHRFFQWDDTAAAAENRLNQARMLLRSIEVVVIGTKGREINARVFLHSSIRGRRYIAARDALTDPGTRAEILERALAEARSWRDRYRHLHELSGVFAALDRAEGRRRSA